MRFLIFIAITTAFANFLRAEYQFPDYQAEYLKNYLEDIAQEFATVGDKEYQESKKQLEKFLKNKQWSEGIVTSKKLLMYQNINASELINIAFFAFKASQNIKSHHQYLTLCRHASHLAYTKASTNKEKTQALMLYSSATGEEISIRAQDLQNLYPIEKLREEDPRFKDIFKFEYTSHTLEETPEGGVLRLRFTHPLNVEQPENYLEITPQVDGFIQAEGTQISASGFQPGIEYSVKIKTGISSVLDEKTDQEKEVGFFVKDLKPRINFPSNTYIYPIQDKIHLPIRTINIDKVRANLYRIPDRGIINNLYWLMGRSYDLGNAERMFSTDLEFNGRSKPNQTITKNLDATKLIPKLQPGVYVLEVRQKGVLEAYDAEVADQWFIITDIGLTTFKSEQTLTVHARAFSNAKSLEGIQLELISADNDVLATATTNEEGFAEFSKEILSGKAGKRPKAVFAKNEKLGFSFLALDKAGFDFSDRGIDGREIHDNADAMVFCERGIYRPDESVNASVILRSARGKAFEPTPITLVLKSPSGIEINREILNGNELGVYTNQYKLADDCPTGMWAVEAYIDPTKASVGSTTFRVDDFSPNKMELILKAKEKVAKLGAAQTCSLSAHYLYGSPVEDREAILEAKISPTEKPFDEWKDFTFGLDNEKFVSQVVTGTSATIHNGEVNLQVDIPSDINCSKALTVELIARLNDTSASQQALTSVSL